MMPKNKRVRNLTISVFLLILSIGLIRSSFEVFKGTGRMRDLENEVAGLQNKKKELEESIEYKKTEEYIEEKARNDLNLIKPGENIYVISGPGSEGYSEQKVLSGSSDHTKKGAKENANWYKWYKLFF
jgi:cell division protein FtsB